MNERLSKILNSPWSVPVFTGVVAYGIGFGTGYILGRRPKSYEIHPVPKLFEGPHADELNEIRANIEAMRARDEEKASYIPEIVTDESDDKDVIMFVGDMKPDEDVEPEVAEFVAEKIKEAMVDHQLPEPEETELIIQNVFNNDNDDWDYEVELKNRTADAPYVIHKDEFWAEEMNYTQSTLTYYSGDNIMADEDDTPVYNYETVVGPLKFGHGSGDPHVFHVRNDKRRAEYEILYADGLFSEDVLGLEIENNERVKNLQHSKTPKFKLE